MKHLNNFEGYNGNYWKIELHDYVASSLRDYTVKTKSELESLTKRILSRIGKNNVSDEDFQDAMDIVSSLIYDVSDDWKDELEYFVNKIRLENQVNKIKKLNDIDIEKITTQAIDNLSNDGFEILDDMSYEDVLEEVEKILLKKDTKKYNI